MTYNVFGGTLNPTLLLKDKYLDLCIIIIVTPCNLRIMRLVAFLITAKMICRTVSQKICCNACTY